MSVLRYPPSQNGLNKTLAAQLDAGVTASATLNNTTNVQNKPGVCVIDRIDSGGSLKSTSIREFVGYAGTSGATLTTLTRNIDNSSSDQDHAIGAVVEFIPDVTWAQAVIDALANLVNVTTLAIDPAKILPTSYLDTDTSLTANSDTKIATQKATKGYVDGHQVMTDAGAYVKPSTDGDEIRAYHSDTTSYTEVGHDGTDSKITTTVGHVVLTPGSSKLVKIAALEQGNTTNTYRNNTVVLTGWCFVTGDGSSSDLNKAITFGITFATAPVVVLGRLGIKDSSDPTVITDFGSGSLIASVSAGNITTGGFTAYQSSTAASTNGRRYGMAWTAIGTL